jgi:hypothetical protein
MLVAMNQATARPAPPQAGPPLGVLALVSTVLLVAGVAGSAALAGQTFPSPYADAGLIRQYSPRPRSR